MKEIKEDAPVNAVGGGHIAGLGVGSQGEPPKKSRMKFKMWRRKVEAK